MDRRERLEYKLTYEALMQTGFRNSMSHWHVQGLYVFTPSGKLLAGNNNPFTPEPTVADLQKGLDAYAKLSRAERLLPRPLDARADRMYPERPRVSPPAGGLVLRSVHRGLDEGVAHDQSVLNPRFYHLDRVWYTREEASEFLPAELRPGARKAVTGTAFDGMVRLYLMANGSGSHFDEPHLKERSLTSEVVSVVGSIVSLRLTGRVRSEADQEFMRKKYRGDLLGYATYDTAKQAFTRFDLLSLGKHNISPPEALPGAPPEMNMGIAFTLNPSNSNDQQMPTKIGLYRYIGLKAGG